MRLSHVSQMFFKHFLKKNIKNILTQIKGTEKNIKLRFRVQIKNIWYLTYNLHKNALRNCLLQ